MIRRYARNTTFKSAVYLYGIMFFNMVAPLITIPYLSRVLRPEGWGTLSFYLALALWLTILGEFGFGLYSSSQIAPRRDDAKYLDLIAAKVLGARVVIYFFLFLFSCTSYLFLQSTMKPELFGLAVALAVSQSMNPIWYFQGMEDLGAVSLFDMFVKAASVLAVFLFVKSSNDVWIAMALQVVAALVSSVFGYALMYSKRKIYFVGLKESLGYIRESRDAFMYKVFSNLYVSSNSFILGLVSSVSQVGFYSGAERLVKAAVGMTHPLTQVLYVKISSISSKPDQTRAIVSFGLRISLAYALAGVFVVEATASMIVNIIFGSGYESMVGVLRVLVLLLPLNVIVASLGVQLMMNRGYGSQFNSFLVQSGIINFVLLLLLGRHYGAMGGAVCIVVAEAWMVIRLITFVKSRKLI
ncbi:oligosaccharide flippase family protein [Deinococcus geothermalis]|uniref:oligosaccharide flippase family protein n=1 Tax=Deinococcus geothermalis TaxID=68909 RepID=UPI0023542DC4|nr:oligosaccharide flippase family protein [Deinococcus geothermalis]